MGLFFTELVKLVKSERIFKRNKKKVEIKVLAALLYFLGLSLRKVSEILSEFESISHEAVREYYRRIKEVINKPEKKERRLVAIDETIIKLKDKQIYVWVAIDVDTKECLAVWVSKGRNRIEAYTFLKQMLKYCENKPEIVVDKAPWYRWALQRLGLKYKLNLR